MMSVKFFSNLSTSVSPWFLSKFRPSYLIGSLSFPTFLWP